MAVPVVPVKLYISVKPIGMVPPLPVTVNVPGAVPLQMVVVPPLMAALKVPFTVILKVTGLPVQVTPALV